MLAELDANGWAFIIGAVGVVLMQMLNTILAYRREQNKIDRELATQLALSKVSLEMKTVSEDVRTIEKATNSLTDRLVASTDKEALARGIKQGSDDERARAKEASDVRDESIEELLGTPTNKDFATDIAKVQESVDNKEATES